MENTPQPKKPNRIYGILGTLAWMLLAFIAGIYVGIHPEWVPNMPWAYHPGVDQAIPTTMHAPDYNSTDTPTTQTQPSAPEH
jgi:hypothetical protein